MMLKIGSHMPRANSWSANILLRALSASDEALIRPHLVRATLGKGQYLGKAGHPIEHHYFLESGVASLVSHRPDEVKVELAAIGREGVTGIAGLMGVASPPHDTFIQIDHAYANRIEASAMRALMEQSTSLRDLMLRFVFTILVQISGNAISNVSDRLDVRLGRWLLMCHDRVDGDEIPLTHEFIALMIGAPRTAVTATLHMLEGDGAVRTLRGRLMISDRRRLEEIVGPSYGTPEEEYRRLIAPFGKPHGSSSNAIG